MPRTLRGRAARRSRRRPAAAPEPIRFRDHHVATRHRDQPVGLEAAQHPVDRGAARAAELGELVLGEGDVDGTVPVPLRTGRRDRATGAPLAGAPGRRAPRAAAWTAGAPRRSRESSSIRSTSGCCWRSSSKWSRCSARVSVRSSATTVALRGAGSRTASSPNKDPGPRIRRVTVSPSGVVTRSATRPLAIRCTVSPGSPSWNTTSWRSNRRRRATDRSARTCASGIEPRTGHCTAPAAPDVAMASDPGTPCVDVGGVRIVAVGRPHARRDPLTALGVRPAGRLPALGPAGGSSG